VTSLIDAARGWRSRADELSDTLKLTMLVGEYMVHPALRAAAASTPRRRTSRGSCARLRRGAAREYDVLLMPTLFP
jgi:amidase